MKIYPDKLAAHLGKRTAPVYLLYGEEPFQLMEMADTLRAHARQQGFAERQVLSASDDTDWLTFRESADSLSLFAERRLIELRMPSGKPGRRGSEVLKQYCERAPDDVLLLVLCGKLDRGASTSAWFKAIDKIGVTIGVWPLNAAQLRSWLQHRLGRHGLIVESAALELIAERVEGNLLAANQEVERLALLHPAGELSVDEVLAAVADSARFSIGDLTQAALEGAAARASRVLRGLQEEDVPPVLVLWSLSQEIRAGARAAEAHAEGVSLDAALKAAGVWQKRVPPLKKAVGRHDVSSWLRLLSASSHVDRLIKGQGSGRVWDALEALSLSLAGQPVVLPSDAPLQNTGGSG